MYTATYSPEDNKLRLYSVGRLPTDVYAKIKAAGFRWAPKQDLFFSPAWTPEREDLLIDLCGEIDDEDTGLVDRAEQRAERFENYADNRAKDAEQARHAVSAIADNIPLGQPILVGHHSEKRARKDAERIENGMRKAVHMWRQSQYWTARAQGAIRAAKYKERPDVRARRIKKLEAEKRKVERTRNRAEFCRKYWAGEMPKKGGGFIEVDYERALWFANLYDHLYYSFSLTDYPRNPPASQYEGAISLWSALGGSDGPEHAIITVEQARRLALHSHEQNISDCDRWLAHYENRLAYERAMLDEQGGTIADRIKPEKGGACKCWVSPRGGWSLIQRVNKVSVTVLDKPPYGDRLYKTNVPFDKLHGLMSKADVDAARASGRLHGETEHGFFLTDGTPKPPTPRPPKEETPFDRMKETLQAGVKVISAPQLFPTPPDIARKMVSLCGETAGCRVLEPSAGTGNLVRAIVDRATGFDCVKVVAVEINQALAEQLRQMQRKYLWANDSNFEIHCADFLACDGDLGRFDFVVMNPPFKNGADIKHIEHALTMLKPGGKVVALCANGPRQRDAFRNRAEHWEDLPPGSFKETGTNVNVALIVLGN